ncbi:4'-phosphopantetheinyl transferase family protein [Pelobacter seleniigenes]|uniref:4'-phosphopantetheinyl transferase family protein n=1 Tax=Pelobacter seleniigenes TaxID=407188 RepID=UPI0009FC724F|nr:4'-phosphopantetheinyl transferase superfamily protein [Pelobacter seleniigenes]
MKDLRAWPLGWMAMNSPERCWQQGPDRLAIDDGVLDLWRFPLAERAVEDVHRQLLSAQELDRAGKLLVEQKRTEFILCRATIRRILSRYLASAPEQLAFTTLEHGKPVLAADVHDRPLSFNLSHAGGWGLLAVTSGAAVGVDIELIDAQLNFFGIASRFFTRHEQNELDSYPAVRQRRGFYRLWTRKEALLKMSGSGFYGVGKGPAEQADYLQHLVVGPGYVATVAVAAAIRTWHCYQFAP